MVTFKIVECHPGLTYIFTVRLRVMQRTVLLLQLCPSVDLSGACIVTKRNNRLSMSQHYTKQEYL